MSVASICKLDGLLFYFTMTDFFFLSFFFSCLETISKVEEVCFSKQKQSRYIPLSVYLDLDVLAHFIEPSSPTVRQC